MVAAGSFLQLLKLEKRGLATTMQAAMYADITITVGEPADHEVGQESVLWIRIGFVLSHLLHVSGPS
jgi:hypothetical protein